MDILYESPLSSFYRTLQSFSLSVLELSLLHVTLRIAKYFVICFSVGIDWVKGGGDGE